MKNKEMNQIQNNNKPEKLKLYLVVYYEDVSKESWFETFKKLDEFQKPIKTLPYLGYVIFYKDDYQKALIKAKRILTDKKDNVIIDITKGLD